MEKARQETDLGSPSLGIGGKNPEAATAKERKQKGQ